MFQARMRNVRRISANIVNIISPICNKIALPPLLPPTITMFFYNIDVPPSLASLDILLLLIVFAWCI
jgi:hypothetical protein